MHLWKKTTGVLIIALVLAIGSLGFTSQPAHAQNGSCYSNAYKVGASGTKYYVLNGQNASVVYQLWYCSNLSENFGTVTMYGPSSVSLYGRAGVHRLSGSDGGEIWFWSSFGDLYPGQTIYSPAVYSPHNLAAACWDDSNFAYCTNAY